MKFQIPSAEGGEVEVEMADDQFAWANRVSGWVDNLIAGTNSRRDLRHNSSLLTVFAMKLALDKPDWCREFISISSVTNPEMNNQLNDVVRLVALPEADYDHELEGIRRRETMELITELFKFLGTKPDDPNE